MEKVELKPCPNPWCEGDHETDVQVRTCRGTASGTLRSAWVECACCDLEGPTRPTVAEAVAAWNTRIEATRANDEEIARYRAALTGAMDAIARVVEGDGGMVAATSWRDDGTPSKHDRCVHGRWMYEGCDTCAEAVLYPVLEYLRETLEPSNG